MALHDYLQRLLIAVPFLLASLARAQEPAASCDQVIEACSTQCARFKADARFAQCESFCRKNISSKSTDAAQCATPADAPPSSPATLSSAPTRILSSKGDVTRERDRNRAMLKAISGGDLKAVRSLIESQRMDPTYVYAYAYNAETSEHEGRAQKLRLTDIFNDVNELRPEARSLDKILALFIELGLDVTATFDARTAWGPSLKTMEQAKDRAARFRAFDLAMTKGLRPNADVRDWLFAEFPQACGRDRSQFAIEVFELLIKHLGTSLQDDLWRAGDHQPETLADALDRLISPANPTRSERSEFALMDQVWENCAPLSDRVDRYLIEGK